MSRSCRFRHRHALRKATGQRAIPNSEVGSGMPQASSLRWLSGGGVTSKTQCYCGVMPPTLVLLRCHSKAGVMPIITHATLPQPRTWH